MAFQQANLGGTRYVCVFTSDTVSANQHVMKVSETRLWPSKHVAPSWPEPSRAF